MKHYTSVLCLYCDLLITTYSHRLHEMNLKYQNKILYNKDIIQES